MESSSSLLLLLGEHHEFARKQRDPSKAPTSHPDNGPLSSPNFLAGWAISHLTDVELRCFLLTFGLDWGKTPAHDRVAHRAGPARLRRRLQPRAVAGGHLARGRAVDAGGGGQPRERRHLLLGAAG